MLTFQAMCRGVPRDMITPPISRSSIRRMTRCIVGSSIATESPSNHGITSWPTFCRTVREASSASMVSAAGETSSCSPRYGAACGPRGTVRVAGAAAAQAIESSNERVGTG